MNNFHNKNIPLQTTILSFLIFSNFFPLKFTHNNCTFTPQERVHFKMSFGISVSGDTDRGQAAVGVSRTNLGLRHCEMTPHKVDIKLIGAIFALL